MKAFPSIVFATNRGRLVAYRTSETGHLKPINTFEPTEGNLKVSELVSDQGGAFPNGTPGTSGYENLPFLEELEIRSLRQIAAKIEETLQCEEPSSWGFAASSEINAAVLELLSADRKENLICNLKLDLTNTPAATLRSRFEQECQNAAPSH